MGRQAYLARLALGRSPFGDPLCDENGDLILGPHTHDGAAKDYVQQFDERGRPINRDTEVANRKLRRAQNEVLKVVGVVRSNQESIKEQPLSSLSFADKKKVLEDECRIGLAVRRLSYFLGPFFTWWLRALRNRIYVFRSSSQPELLPMLRSEVRILGIRSFLFSGLSWKFIADSIRGFRYRTLYCHPRDRMLLTSPRSRYAQYEVSTLGLLKLHHIDVILFSLEWPFRAFGDLQSLGLIAMTAVPGWPSFWPLSASSPLQISSLLQNIAVGDIRGFCSTILNNSFLYAYLLDIVRENLETGLRATFYNISVMAFRPNPVSIAGSTPRHRRNFNTEKILVLGERLGIPEAEREKLSINLDVPYWRRHRGPPTLSTSLQAAFPGFFGLLKLVPAINSYLGPHMNERHVDRVMEACNSHYSVLHRHCHASETITDEQIRAEAVLQGVSDYYLEFAKENIDIGVWMQDLVLDDNDASTATPEEISPSLLPETAREHVWRRVGRTIFDDDIDEATRTIRDAMPGPPTPSLNHVGNLVVMPQPDGPAHQATDIVPLNTILEPINLEPLLDILQLGSTPEPGINRAPSLPSESVRPHIRRRPTVLENRGAVAGSLRSRASSMDEPVDRVPTKDNSLNHVTILSLLPADAFALHASNILTALLMLPIDMYYIRVLARSFLSASGLSGESHVIRGDLWPTSPWLGVRDVGLAGSCSLAVKILLTFGFEHIVTTILWKGLVKLVLRQGRRQFGWGLF